MASLSRKIKRAQQRKNRHSGNAFSQDSSLEKLQKLGVGMGGALILLTLPTAGIAGSGFTQTQDGKTTTYNQTAPKVYNRVNSYNIAADELHRYNQPSTDAVFVQRVMGGDYSSILGQLIANGQVWVMNPGGVLIGSQATVNTAGFMATSLVMGEDDFFAGRYLLKQEGKDSFVINRGNITVNNGGYAILAGGSVVNNGYIQANMGEVVLASGRAMTMDFNGDGLINFAVDEKVAAKITGPDGADLTTAVLNAGQIKADGGRVTLTAKAAASILDSVVNNTGVIEAKSAIERNGEIVLLGSDEGVVANSGTLDVSGKEAGATGGTVKVLGEYVGLFGQTKIDAAGDAGGGTILVGGSFQGKGPEPNALRTFVGNEAIMNADALKTGDGGMAVVWSDNATSFYGNISARGGALSGNGGFAEVSGKQGLSFDGKVDLSAPQGAYGTLLLDPNDIFINGAGHTDGNGSVTAAQLGDKTWNAATDYDVSDTAIATALKSANVTLAASHDIATAAAVSIDPNDASAVNTRTLTLSADNNVIIGNSFALTNSAGATGPSLLINAANGILLGNTVTTKGGSISFNNAVTLTGASQVGTTAGGAPGNNIIFGSTIDGAQNLGLIAGTGNVTLTGVAGTAPGNANNLTSLTVTSATEASLNDVFTSGNQAVTADAINLNGANYISSGGSLIFTGPTQLNNDVTAASGGTAGNNINFTGTVDGAHSLDLIAGAGDVTLTGVAGTAPGDANNLASFTVESAAQANLNDVYTTGDQAVTAGNINLNGTAYASSEGTLLFAGATQLNSDVTATAGGALGNDITFDGTVNGAQALEMAAGLGNATVTGVVGTGPGDGANNLTSFTVVSAAQANLNDVFTSGNQAVTADAINLNGANYISSGGSLIFTGPTQLGNDVTAASGGAVGNDITFNGTVNGAHSLDLIAGTGDVTLTGAAGTAPGDAGNLASFTVENAAHANLNNVYTSGDQAVTADAINLNGTAYTSSGGALLFAGDTQLNNEIAVTSGGALGNDITFIGTVNGARDLELNAGLGDVAITGIAGTAPGNANNLTSFTIPSATNVSLNDVYTSGNQTVTAAAIFLNGGNYLSSGGSLTFTGPTQLGSDITVASGGALGNNITFDGTVDSNLVDVSHSLDLIAGQGDVAITGITGTAPGLVNNLTSLTVTSAANANLNSVYTSGDQTVTADAINLNGTAYASSGGSLLFAGATQLNNEIAVTSGGAVGNDISFAGTVNGAHELDVNAGLGDAAITGIVGTAPGAAGNLTIIKVDSATNVSLNDVYTSGDQTVTALAINLNGANYYISSGGSLTFTGPTQLGSDVTAASGGAVGNNITFNGTVDSSTVDVPHSLDLIAGLGDVTITGVTGTAPGLVNNLTSFTVESAANANLNNVYTAGDQAVTADAINLNGTAYASSGGALLFAGATQLNNEIAVTSGGAVGNDINFIGTVNGARDLELNAGLGDVAITGIAGTAPGNANNLASFTMQSATNVSLNDVYTSGDQTVAALAIFLNGANYLSSGGSLTFTGPTQLGSDITVASGGAVGNNITFDGTVDSNLVDISHSLDLIAGQGDVTITGVTGTAPGLVNNLTSLTVTSASNASLNDVFTTGDQTVTAGTINLNGNTYASSGGSLLFAGATQLGNDVTAAAGGAVGNDITFTGTVDGARSLDLIAGAGDVSITGVAGTAPGNANNLASFTVESAPHANLNAVYTTGDQTVTAGTINLNGGTYASSGGTLLFAGATQLNNDVTAASGGAVGNNIAFNGTIDGAHSLDLIAGAGDVTITGVAGTAPGNVNNLASFTVESATQASLNDVFTTGDQAVTAGTIGLNGTSYTSSAGTLLFAGATQLNNDVTAASGGAVGNDITFTGTVDGAHSLDLIAGTGDVTLTGVAGTAPGNVNNLTSFTVTSAANANLNSVYTSGDQTVTADAINLNGTAYASSGGSLLFAGATQLNNEIVATSGGAVGNDITFAGTVNGARDLELNAGLGDVAITGIAGTAPGNANNLASFTMQSATNVSLNDVYTSGDQTVAALAISLNGANYISSGGSLTFTGPTQLGSDITVASGGALGNNITFNGTVDSSLADVPHSLDLIAGQGDVTITGVAGTAPVLANNLTSLTVTSAANANLNSVYTTANQAVTADAINLNGTAYASSGGSLLFAGATQLNNEIAATSGGAVGNDITFAGTVNGARDLELNAGLGDLAITGIVGTAPGNANNLASFTVQSATNASLNDIYTTGNQTVAALAINLNGANYISSGGSLTFTGPTQLGSDITAASGGAVGNNITFDGTVDSNPVDVPHSLDLIAGQGDVTITGVTGTAPGLVNNLTSLTVESAANANLNSIYTTGDQAVTASAINLSGTDYASSGGALLFTGNTQLSNNVTATSGGAAGNDITFTGTINGAHGLALSAGAGNVSIAGVAGTAPGDVNNLTSFTVGGAGNAQLNDVYTSGNQAVTAAAILLNGANYLSSGGALTFTGPAQLGSDVTLASGGAAGNNITFTGTVDGAHSLDIIAGAGDAAITGVAGTGPGNGNNLTSLTVESAAQASLNSVFTTGDQVITAGAINLNGTNYASSGGALSFAGATQLNSDLTAVSGGAAGNDITFTGTINGAHSLGLSAGTGNVMVTGLAGDAAPLGAITVSSANDVTTNGVRSASFLQLTGAGTTTLNAGAFTDGKSEAVATTAAAGVNILAKNIAVNGGITAAGSGTINLSATDNGGGTLTTGAAVNLAAGGAVNLRATGGLSTSGNIQTNNPADITVISTGGDVTMAGGTSYTTTFSGGSGNVTLAAAGNILLGQIADTGGTATLTATGGYIKDNNGGTNNVTAATLNVTAASSIGEVGNAGVFTANNVLTGPKDALETAVSTLNATTTNALGNTEIAMDNTLAGALTPAITLPAGNGNQIWIRNSQDLNVAGPLAGGTARLDTRPGNNYGFIATNGTLTVQNTATNPLNVGPNSSLNLQGGTTVAGLGGSAAGTADVASRDFLLKTGAGGGNVSLNTDTANLDITVTGTGKTLTVHQITGAAATGLNVTDLDGDTRSMGTNAGAIGIYQDNQDRNLTVAGTAALPGYTVDAKGADITLQVNPVAGGLGHILIGTDAVNHFANVTTDGGSTADTGTLNITGGVNINGTVHSTAGRRIDLIAPSATITVDQNGFTGSGSLTLDPGNTAGGTNDVVVASGADIVIQGAGADPGNLTVENANNFTMGANSSITVAGGLTVQNIAGTTTLNDVNLGTGNFTMSNAGSTLLNGTLNANGQNVSINLTGAGGGSFTTGTSGLISNTGSLNIMTLGNIGTSAAPVNVNAANITLQTTGANQPIFLTNTASASIPTTFLTAATAGGSLNYTQNGGGLTTGSITTNGGQVVIDPPTDITVTALINSGGGNVEMNATNSITFAAGGKIQTAGGAVLLNADSDASGAGALTFSVAGTGAGNNAIVYSAGGQIDAFGETITLSNYALDGGTGTVTLTAGRQAASNGTIAGQAGGPNIAGGIINLNVTSNTAQTVIGAAGAGNGLNINPATMVNAAVSGSTAAARSVNIAGTGALPVGAINVDAGNSGSRGDVTLSATGAITDGNGALSNITARNLTITGDGTTAVQLGATTLSGALDVASHGNITESGALSVAGTTSLAAGTGNDITLDNPANDFAGPVNVASSRNFTFADANNFTVGDMNAAGTANITAANSILNDGIVGTQITAPVANLVATAGTIGAPNMPVEVDVTGTLYVLAGGMQNGLSANLQGPDLSALKVDPAVQGLILFHEAQPGAPLSNGTPILSNNFLSGAYLQGTAQNTADLANEAEDYALTLDVYGDAIFAPYADMINFMGAGVAPYADEENSKKQE